MLARAVWLTWHEGDGRLVLARGAAREAGLRVAELVLDCAPPLRALPPARAMPAARAHAEGPRAPPRADHTRRLLAEPALVLQDVVAMCARRPTTAELLAEVAISMRWIAHGEVREALVSNLFTSASIAVRLLPKLATSRHARTAAEVDPRLREIGRLLSGSA